MPPPVEPYAHISHRQDAFSGAYVRAICAATGCGCESVTLDNDKIDYTISSHVVGTVRTKPKIDLQVKCKLSEIATNDPISYSIDIETYDNLRDPNVSNPRILVLCLFLKPLAAG
jgi:hypothetical protein